MWTLIAVAALIGACIMLRGWNARGTNRPHGWQWFLAWAVGGASMSLSWFAAASFGLLLFPFAAALLIWLLVRAARPLEAVGFLEGVGLTLILIALINHDYRVCTLRPALSLPGGTPARTTHSCGGVDPTPWLVVGAAFSTLA